jgi:hypothetical protein
MIFGFETADEHAATGAMLVYGIYRSRDIVRFKVTPGMWGTIESAVKGSSKRAGDLNDFVERLKPKLYCATLQPRWMGMDETTVTMAINRDTGEILEQPDTGKRQFWTSLVEATDNRAVLDVLYRKTSWVIALVRDRLERERPLEAKGFIKEDKEEVNG